MNLSFFFEAAKEQKPTKIAGTGNITGVGKALGEQGIRKIKNNNQTHKELHADTIVEQNLTKKLCNPRPALLSDF